MPEVETYSNPIAPPDQEIPGASAADSKKAKLTNDDFRRLMMTPRPSAPGGASESKGSVTTTTSSSSKKHERHRKSVDGEDEEKRQKRKTYYAQLRKEEEERQEEWAKKYRDRARERRDGENPDYEVSEDAMPATSGYRAVAPNIEPTIMQERRKQLIQESKFLGGDMQHTHLVKGLDYVLLDKVRGEMQHKQLEEEELSLLEKKKQREVATKKQFTDDLKFKTTLAKNVYRTLFLTKPPERNEFFTAGRMAYVFELDDEYAESDIPTTLLRSKADCPTQEVTTLSTNDIVINKLTQILSYLRQGSRSGKKGKKKDKGLHSFSSGVKVKDLPTLPPPAKITKPAADTRQDSIFDDVGAYVFDPKAESSSHAARGAYFDQPSREKEVTAKEIHSTTTEFVKAVSKRYNKKQVTEDTKKEEAHGEASAAAASSDGGKKKGDGFGGLVAEGHYAECYPGGMEEYDATYDSDEDVDFSKMDMGNKKGPVKRWDFDNDDDYNSYQSNREALPRAAFQYGVKMSEGRKTRRFGGGMTGKAKEKAKLNREWQQISALLEKRKRTGNEDYSGSKRQKVD